MSFLALFRRRPTPRPTGETVPIRCEVGWSEARPGMVEMAFIWPDGVHRYQMTEDQARRMVRLLIGTLQAPPPDPEDDDDEYDDG